MNNISDFLNNKLFEARTPKVDKNISDAKRDGKPAAASEKGGVEWGLNEPVDDSPMKGIDKATLNKNMKRLLMKFKAKEDFFILGEAGWGKTSVIEDMAEKFGYEVKTVYLDKAEATDLGGIPVPMKDDKGHIVTQHTMPDWAQDMANNPKKKYLLFFDEMNQAAPDVQNALMPIVLKHEICGQHFDNFFVGAAGNYESENQAVSELSGPLKSRFKPIINWETGAESWKSAFEYLHKKWDEKLSKSLIDKFEKNASLFVNPREVEHKILQFIYNLKEDGEDLDVFDTEDYYDRLKDLAHDDLGRSENDALKELAESIQKYLKGEEEEGGRKKEKGRNMIKPALIACIKDAMEKGFFRADGSNISYGISKENVTSAFEGDGVNAEMISRVVDDLEESGVKWKFKKDEEWKKKGYADPNDAEND